MLAMALDDPTLDEDLRAALLEGNEDVAWYAMYLTIYWARNEGMEMYRGFLAMHPGFRRLPLSGELEMILREQGFVTLFE